MTELADHQQKHAELVLKTGRVVLWVLCFSIPLAFCKETMYIFQIKTFLLQTGGVFLLSLLALHQVLVKGRDRVIGSPILVLLLAFVIWQVYKSFDSIAPVISKRNLSRVVWLPIFAFAFQYFVRTRPQFERVLSVMVTSAVLAFAYAGFLFTETGAGMLQSSETFIDFKQGFLGKFLSWFFYPDNLRYLSYVESFPGFALSPKSFDPGKFDAGTFGNKNFLAAYINMMSMLIVYRSITLMRSGGWQIWVGVVLFLISLASFVHLVPLENRGSWLGFIAGGFMAGLFLVFKSLSRQRIRLALIGLGAVGFLLVSGVYLLSPERFVSIFSMSHGSNELRRHTWTNYLEAWAQDDQWSGFEGDLKRWMTGFGFYSFRVNYPKVRSERIFQLENNQHNSETTHPHNEYVGLLGELGIVGLGLYLIFIAWMLIKLWRKRMVNRDDQLLNAVLVFALVSILVHQFVTVGVRYTGVAFQVWLLFSLVLWSEFGEQRVLQAWQKFVALPCLIVIAFSAMPSLDWPMRWMRSQHAYEMGQIYFTTLGNYHGKLRAHQNKMTKATQEIKKIEQSGQKVAPEAMASYQRGLEILKRQIEIFDDTFEKANKYFDAGFELDPANFESVYIGSNLYVQFANQDLGIGQLNRAHERYQKALKGYAKIEGEMPYFVQLRYWQGAAYKGLATVEIKKVEHPQVSPQQKELFLKQAGLYLQKALTYYDQYEKQDPTYKELFLDRYFCYRYLDQTDKALHELVKVLQNMERNGNPIFSAERRHDARSLMGHAIKLVDPQDLNKALVIYRNLLRYYNSSLLLPFVPKTERHIKNSFRLLDI